MTDEELQKLEELEQKATSEGWVWSETKGEFGYECEGVCVHKGEDEELICYMSDETEEDWRDNAMFIVSIRNAAKSLIASARREKELEAALEKGEQLCNEYDQRAQNDGFGDKRSPELYGAGAAASDIRRIIRKALQKGE